MNPIPDEMKDGAQRNEGVRPSKRIGLVQGLTHGLYIVSTPIGNLGDLSPRATHILQAADVIACEDTRVTGKLLKRYGVDTQMIAYHDHSSPAVRAGIISASKMAKPWRLSPMRARP